MIVLVMFLFCSIVLNIFLIWYAVQAIRKISFITESLEIINLDLEFFSRHVKGLYELEMFYGDETLKNLIIHSRKLLDSFKEYEVDYGVFNGNIDERILIKNDEEKENKIDTTEKENSEE